MAEGRFVSYLRVSTQKQGRSGLGIGAQRKAVANYLNGGQWELIEEVVEQESGKNSRRPQLTRALALCRLHDATLVVAKLDRLARNVAFIANLMERKVRFVAADMPEANDLNLHIMAAMAEYEAKAIKDRTKRALAEAKARGKKLGGYRWPKGWDIRAMAKAGNAESIIVRAEAARERASNLMPEIEAIKAEAAKNAEASTLRRIAAGLNKRRIRAPRGGKWSAAQVRRVMPIVVSQQI